MSVEIRIKGHRDYGPTASGEYCVVVLPEGAGFSVKDLQLFVTNAKNQVIYVAGSYSWHSVRIVESTSDASAYLIAADQPWPAGATNRRATP